ncbi:MAG: 50S ribosomal protein L29 [Anaerolineae bacterium]|nr:50S ribosomal protein L29 [Anaerolineae bacterium]
MRAYEIRNMSDQDIASRLEEAYEELFNLRFQYAIGQAKDSNQVTRLKRDIARMKTVLNERKLVVLE